jgi:glycosyltransferase involved in cell wall biosynthesis
VKLAALLSDLQPYGSQRVALRLAEVMGESHELSVVTVGPATQHDLPIPPGVRHVPLGDRTWRFLPGVAALRDLLEALRPDGLISHTTYPNLLALAAIPARHDLQRVLITEHNLLRENISVLRFSALKRRLVRLLYPTASAVVGVSKGVVDDLAETFGVPSRLIQTIYNPLDVRDIEDAAGAEAPHPWLRSDTERTLVCVASFREPKGHAVLLDAMRELSLDGFRLILVGDGPLRSDIEATVKRSGLESSVALVGFQPNPYPWIANSAALVSPSLWEGFGLAIVEAAILGVPVVATRVPGPDELVPRIVPGLLVEPADPRGLASAIRAAVEAPHLKRGLSRDAASRFDPRHVAHDYERCLLAGSREASAAATAVAASARTVRPLVDLQAAAARRSLARSQQA